MSTESLPVAVQVAYEVWVWLDGRVEGFPANARRALGDRLLSESIDLLGDLVLASYAKRRSERQRRALEQASDRVALLRLLLRGARERRYLSIGQHEHVMSRLVELGRMLGGWKRDANSSAD